MPSELRLHFRYFTVLHYSLLLRSGAMFKLGLQVATVVCYTKMNCGWPRSTCTSLNFIYLRYSISYYTYAIDVRVLWLCFLLLLYFTVLCANWIDSISELSVHSMCVLNIICKHIKYQVLSFKFRGITILNYELFVCESHKLNLSIPQYKHFQL